VRIESGWHWTTVVAMAITPDDKDWTWVLHQPCGECGFDARRMDVATTPSLVVEFTDAWQAVLRQPDVSTRPSPDKWSPLEYACHVRDVFRLFGTRLESMIDEDGARFENWDQDKTAIESRYDAQDPLVVSHEIVEAGSELSRRFARVHGDLWHHRGIRSNGSEFTITTFALYFAHDPIHHLWDVHSPYVFNPTP